MKKYCCAVLIVLAACSSDERIQNLDLGMRVDSTMPTDGEMPVTDSSMPNDAHAEPDAVVEFDMGPDLIGPTIVSSTPADGAHPVSVLSSIAIVFDEALDEATVANAFTITSHAAGLPDAHYASSVSYDAATHTVTIDPDLPLPYATTIQVEIGTGICDALGNAFAGQTMAFTTYFNSSTRIVSYTSGAISKWFAYTLDARGRRTQTLSYGSGTNGLWLDADDDVTARSIQTFDAMDRENGFQSYLAGADGLLNTADDVIERYFQRDFDDAGFLIKDATHEGAGPDMSWHTADDLISFYARYDYVGGLLTAEFSYNIVGADATWMTADDLTSTGWHEYVWNTSEQRTRAVNRTSGADQMPRTTDDVPAGYTDFTYNASGTLRRLVARAGVGPDGLWFTSDDVIGGWEASTYDSLNAVTSETRYNGAGVDGMWLNGNDTISRRRVYTYDANHLPTEVDTYSGAGADGMWGTPDDALSWIMLLTYDANGNVLEVQNWESGGSDGVWHTTDDWLQTVESRDVTR